MSYFNKVIAYIDLFEREEKRKNIGFIKITQKDNKCNFQITVKGLRSTDTMKCLMKETATGKEVDEFSLVNGQGNYHKEFSVEKVGKSELSFLNMTGIQILISGDRYGMARWKEEAEREMHQEETIKESAPEALPEVAVLELAQELRQQPRQEMREESIAESTAEIRKEVIDVRKKGIDVTDVTDVIEGVEEEAKSKQEAVELLSDEEKKPVSEVQSVEKKSLLNTGEAELYKKEFTIPEQSLAQEGNTERKEQVRAVEEASNIDDVQHKTTVLETVEMDKWQQLCRIYPMVHPFSHKRGEYLSIEPKDFVVLQSQYQGLVNNSFLLHGFYNYRHILLAKRDEGEGVRYYIGVPGNYYTREKTVAVMFGFEAFESTREESDGRENWSIESIPQGTYGYYLCRVEL